MDLEAIERMLQDTLIGRLAMADAAGRPYVIPLPFCWLKGAVYLRLPMTGRKAAVLAQNPKVCFEADWVGANLCDYASVLVEGRIVPVLDLEEKAAVKAANDCKYHRLRNGQRPGHGRQTPLATLPIRKIEVEALSGRRKERAISGPRGPLSCALNFIQ